MSAIVRLTVLLTLFALPAAALADPPGNTIMPSRLGPENPSLIKVDEGLSARPGPWKLLQRTSRTCVLVSMPVQSPAPPPRFLFNSGPGSVVISHDDESRTVSEIVV